MSRALTGRTTAWGIVVLAAIGVPPTAVAAWMGGAYTATPADLLAGAWLLKAALVLVAGFAIAVDRLPIPDATEATSSPPIGTGVIALVGGIVVLAFALRVNHIGAELWLDEILTRVRYVPLRFQQLLSTYDSQNHQPFYSLMARLSWLSLGGADWTIRVPAVLFGVGSIITAWHFGRRIASEQEAILAALLLAVSYHHVWFSQNARGYTVMLCLTIPATGIFHSLCRGPVRPGRLVWTYALLMALATYTHLTAALIAVGHAVALLLSTRWNVNALRRAVWPVAALGLSALLTLTFYAPMLPQVIRDVTEPTLQGVEVEWTGAGWMLAEGLRVMAHGVPGGLVTVSGGLVVMGVGLVSYWRQSRLTTLLMFVPPVLTLLTVLAARHNLWPRFFFFAAAFLVLAALRGGFVLVRWLVRWQPNRVATLGATMVAGLSLLTVPRAWQPKQRFQEAHDYVERMRQPGDQVVGLDIAGHVYLFRGQGESWGFTSSLTMLAASERSATRTWVVYTLPTRLRAIAPDLNDYLAPPRYQVIRVFPATVGGGEIFVLRRDSAGVP